MNIEAVIATKNHLPQNRNTGPLHTACSRYDTPYIVAENKNELVTILKIELEQQDFFALSHVSRKNPAAYNSVLLDSEGRFVVNSALRRNATEERSITKLKVWDALSKKKNSIRELTDFCDRHVVSEEVSFLIGFSLLESPRLGQMLDIIAGPRSFATPLASHKIGRLMNAHVTGDAVDSGDFVPVVRESIKRGNFSNVETLVGLPPAVKAMNFDDARVLGTMLFEKEKFSSAERIFADGYNKFPDQYQLYLRASDAALQQNHTVAALVHSVKGVIALNEFKKFETEFANGHRDSLTTVGKELFLKINAVVVGLQSSPLPVHEVWNVFDSLEVSESVRNTFLKFALLQSSLSSSRRDELTSLLERSSDKNERRILSVDRVAA